MNIWLKSSPKEKIFEQLHSNPLLNAEVCANVFPTHIIQAAMSDRVLRKHSSSAQKTGSRGTHQKAAAGGTAKKQSRRQSTRHTTELEHDVIDVTASVSPNDSTIATYSLASAPMPMALKSPISPSKLVESMQLHHVKHQRALDALTYSDLPLTYIVDPKSNEIVASAVILVSPTHHVPKGLLTSSPPFELSKEEQATAAKFEYHTMPLAFVQQKVSRQLTMN